MANHTCDIGFTASDLESLLTEDQLADLHQWLWGQTQGICEGRKYVHETGTYEEACGGVAHGVATYPWDVERFMASRGIDF